MTIKRILFLLFLLYAGETWGQKWEVNSVRNDYVYAARFDRFVTDKDRTVADVTLRYFGKMGWIQYDKGVEYLRDRESGKMYKLIGAENFELNSQVVLPESGEIKARFIFEPLDKEAKCLDFHGWNPPFRNTWGIWLSDPPMTLPAWAEGAWMTTNGSNRWVCGFFPQVAVWENDFWEYGEVTKKGRNVWVELRKEGKDTTFCLREGEEGTLLFGVDGKKFDTLGKEFVSRSGGEVSTWSYDPEKYRNKLYNKGIAIIRGIFEGYSPDLGFTTGTIESHDILTQEDYTHLIDIQPDGRFELKMELEHPQHVTMKLNDAFSGLLFVEPGDTLMCRFTLTDMFNPMYQNIFSTPARMDHSRFMGRAAEYNMYYWNKVKPMMPTIDTMYLLEKRCVERGAADEFKASIDRRLQMVKDSLRTLASRYAVSDRTMDLLYAEYTQREYGYKSNYAGSVYRSSIISEMTPNGYISKPNPNYIPLPNDYFDFFSMDWMDDPLMITGYGFDELIFYYFPFSIMRIDNSFSKDIEREMANADEGQGLVDDVTYVTDKIRTEHPELTKKQLCELDSIKQRVQNAMYEESNQIVNMVKDTLVRNMFSQHLNELYKQKRLLIESLLTKADSLRREYLYSRAFDTMKSYGLDRNLVFDYMLCRDFKDRLYQCLDADSSDHFIFDQMSKILPYVKTPYVIKNIMQEYMDIFALRNMTEKTSIQGDKSQTSADKYFEELIAPYAGNVLYIDFWSTGCAPCKQEMIKAREHIEAMKDRKIKFLYITSEDDSPLEAYQKFLDQFQIKGEHLRITKDQWNLLTSKFDIYGIPHCVIVNKQGEVVDNNSGRFRTMSNCLDALDQLIEE